MSARECDGKTGTKLKEEKKTNIIDWNVSKSMVLIIIWLEFQIEFDLMLVEIKYPEEFISALLMLN